LTQLKPVHVAATMVVVFGVSLGILWWQRNHANEPAALPSAAPAPPPSTAAAPILQQAASGRLAQAPAEVRAANARPSQIEAPAPSDGDAELPVVFSIVNKPDFLRDRSTNFEGAWKKVNEGIISNGADKPLTITVIDTDVPTQEKTQATFELGKGAQRHFGVQDGLKMSSGDQLMVRSPPYHDMIQQIP
jgi:hypothetical protein